MALAVASSCTSASQHGGWFGQTHDAYGNHHPHDDVDTVPVSNRILQLLLMGLCAVVLLLLQLQPHRTWGVFGAAFFDLLEDAAALALAGVFVFCLPLAWLAAPGLLLCATAVA
jgi:hypothetical protein